MYLVISQALLVVIFSYMAQILMKKGSMVFSNFTWKMFLTNPLKTLGMFLFNWQVMLGFVLAGNGAIIYLFVLSKNDFGVIFPILGTLGFLALPLISWLVLNESLSLGRIFDTVIIAIGMLIVTRG